MRSPERRATLGVDSRQSTADSPERATRGTRLTQPDKPATGNRQPATGNRRPATGNPPNPTPVPAPHIQLIAHDLLAGELAAGRAVGLEVTTASMRPCLVPGDRITVAPLAAAARLCAGDLVLVGAGPDWLVHRYLGPVRVNHAACVLTRGDHAHRCDTPVRPDAVLGKVVGIRRAGRELAVRPGAPHRLLATLAWVAFRVRRIPGRLRRAAWPARGPVSAE